MNAHISSIIKKLYLTISGAVLLIVAFMGYQDVSYEFKKNERFDRAHSNMEKAANYDPLTGKHDLFHSRIVVSLLSRDRQSNGTKGPFNPTHYLIDNTCFNMDGEIINRTSYCDTLSSFRVGSPGKQFMWAVFYFLLTGAILYAIWRWANWLIAKPKHALNET